MRLAAGQRQHFITELGNQMAPWAAGRAEEQMMDDASRCAAREDCWQNRAHRGET
jgi:hypothetical protein